MKRYLLQAAAVIGVLTTGCYNDKAELLYPATGSCVTDSVTYKGTITTIMNQNCAISSCHNAQSAAGGIVLDNYNGVKTVAGSGILLGVINHTAGVPMPKDRPKLYDCTIQKITKWVADGAPNN